MTVVLAFFKGMRRHHTRLPQKERGVDTSVQVDSSPQATWIRGDTKHEEQEQYKRHERRRALGKESATRRESEPHHQSQSGQGAFGSKFNLVLLPAKKNPNVKRWQQAEQKVHVKKFTHRPGVGWRMTHTTVGQDSDSSSASTENVEERAGTAPEMRSKTPGAPKRSHKIKGFFKMSKGTFFDPKTAIKLEKLFDRKRPRDLEHSSDLSGGECSEISVGKIRGDGTAIHKRDTTDQDIRGVPSGSGSGREVASWEIYKIMPTMHDFIYHPVVTYGADYDAVIMEYLGEPWKEAANFGEVGIQEFWSKDNFPIERNLERIQKAVALAITWDWLLMNTDRHFGNFMLNKKTGDIAFIDNGLILADVSTGEAWCRNGIRQYMRNGHLGNVDEMPIPKEVISLVKEFAKNKVAIREAMSGVGDADVIHAQVMRRVKKMQGWISGEEMETVGDLINQTTIFNRFG